MREMLGFPKIKMGITRGADGLTSFQVVHTPTAVAGVGTR